MDLFPTSARLSAASLLLLAATTGSALEPPTAAQLERYRRDGSLAARIEAAADLGNHRLAPQLAARPAPGVVGVKALPGAAGLLPSDGSPRVLTLLIAFDDMPGFTDPTVVDDRLYGDGEPNGFPYESMTAFYRRSSFGLLEISGSALGWYTTPYPRADVEESYLGRQALIKEAINHFDAEGHDFSQYDNDGDGVMDYVIIVWTGEHGEWAEFWWGYKTNFWNDDFTVDGVEVGTYSWQWENYDWPGEFTPEVVIHETGHALGLPDYYDYDDAVGPRGGVGGLDQMAGNRGDHNAFSKWVLGWLTPEVHNQDAHQLQLAPTDAEASAAVVMHGDPVADPYAEYFLIEHRRRAGNDAELPNDGLLIWHVDARVDPDGRFLYNNSFTEHKLLRLMEADGLEEIEQGGRADAGDFYTPGSLFNATSTPSSHRYDGVPTNIAVDSIASVGIEMGLQVDLGSGCALWCDASVTPNAWPGLPVSFNGSLDTANCEGSASYGWVFGDGASSGETSATHRYVSTGSYDWSVTASLEDATCGHGGSVLVCTDFPCWSWLESTPMAWARASHAAVTLADDRILVVGGPIEVEQTAEIFDPSTGFWAAAAPSNEHIGSPQAVRLTDGRVLVIDSDNTEIYDPTTDTWTITGHLNHDRLLHSAVTLGDGRVLVAGGLTIEPPHIAVGEVEVYDPHSESWSVIGTIVGERLQPGLVLLHDGRALIVGGRDATAFDPISDTLARATPLPDEWQWPVAATLDDGRVLMAGVANGGMTLLWNPADGKLEIGGRHGTHRQIATTTKLPNGYVLVTGGHDFSGNAIDSTEYFDPTTNSWSTGASLVTARFYHTATLLDIGTLMLTGGANRRAGRSETSNEVEILVQPTTPPRGIGGRVTP
jgi:M6 family metalloprotease-like protein